jgi:hypothetical protein
MSSGILGVLWGYVKAFYMISVGMEGVDACEKGRK